MGGTVSRSEEVEQPRPSDRHPLQPPEQRGWSLALTTQPPQFDPSTKNHFSAIYQSERLEKAETTYTEETATKVDSLVSQPQPYAAERSFESLVVSECEPKLKSRAKTTLLRHHQQPRAQYAANRDLTTEEGSVDPHPLERLEKSVPHKVTLKLWIEEERLLRSTIHEQEAYCTSAERDVYLILGLNFLFQAVIVAGTAQASALDCHSSWVPLIMSLIVSVATFLATLHKLGAREELLSRLRCYKTDTRVILQYIDKLRSLGDLFDLMDLPQLTSSLPKGRANCFPKKLIFSFSFFVLLILSLFSVITFVSFRSILCHH
ncbi:hypothetical protein O6H91_04G045300 [Diphasiastrum complanatum]|nr:hypothetical protein O6H91_04G045300 [Diphasiastrum complanatum]